MFSRTISTTTYQEHCDELLLPLTNNVLKCKEISLHRILQSGEEGDLSSCKEIFSRLQHQINLIAITALYPGHTGKNFGDYSLAGRISLLGERILAELTEHPETTPPSLQKLEELVALSQRAIRSHSPLPILEEEADPFLHCPSPPRDLFSCCRKKSHWQFVIETTDLDGEGLFSFRFKSIHKQPYGNYSLTVKELERAFPYYPYR